MRKISQFPLLKQLWAFWREKKILDKHQQVAGYWDVVIDDYKHGKIAKYNIIAKQEFRNSKIIWQYWGQGTNSPELPEVVKICFDSVDQYKGDYIVIRLNDENFSEYIDLPEFVLEKKDGPVFNRTFFSDVLRLALLKTYGGVWLDATVMLTGSLPEQFSSLDYFVYQRDSNEQHKDYWENVYAYYWGWNKGFKVCMLNSIFFAKKGSVMVSALLDLMLYYWKTQNDILDYFFFQILYKQLMAREYNNEVCPVVSDTIPHIIQTKLSGGCKYITYEEALKQSNIHKLTYKDINIEEFMTFVQDKTNINLVK
ncbi:capsular biosynthesis protein [Elizabethkingia anophelis]|uniref:capsular polysaccharide synthesis protein n=1 Tax=Elizabethkingia anophelis TaxID=1117645 RepID=UPI00099AB9D7|nr:capsular polysaccharide synthesis protein [Elizabethkingia anophelis]MCT4287907.1 capsular biosynthesis protein [Elizabethkingia anophelis]MDV3568283.1 capsular biosynthesis protein [Elizabethkingia anophelis]MDV3969851.1 capsular biosynthesis protein [Elizabethkingia anophelis]OPC31784.1 capsular biosynthesis protein [Elizabethkingia anophelis]OPC39763.1 capsular biosynthesis protein [Elizabethkingia anophelis]